MIKPRKNCIICEKEIYRSSVRGCKRTRRGEDNLTCSKECSKIYQRIYHHVRDIILRKLKNETRKS